MSSTAAGRLTKAQRRWLTAFRFVGVININDMPPITATALRDADYIEPCPLEEHPAAPIADSWLYDDDFRLTSSGAEAIQDRELMPPNVLAGLYLLMCGATMIASNIIPSDEKSMLSIDDASAVVLDTVTIPTAQPFTYELGRERFSRTPLYTFVDTLTKPRAAVRYV